MFFSSKNIANDNLQYLKTGQLGDATPWKQQVALIIGVVAGAIVIPPILDVLNKAFGFAGAANLDTISDQPLAAPQAVPISTLAKGVIQGDLPWTYIGVGAALGLALVVVVVVVDEALRRTGKYSLPPLGVGESLFNVALAGFIVATNNPSPIAVAPASFPEQFMWAGAGVFALIVLGLYLWTELKSRDFPLLEQAD